jgi:N-acetylneuraminic acid mutarotase
LKKTRITIGLILLLLFSLMAVPSSFSSTSIASDYWTQVAPLPKPYYSIYGAAALNGIIYFIGDGVAERFDAETNIWTEIASMPKSNSWPVGGGMVTACENKIYVMGLPDEPTHVYDPATNTWSNRSSVPGWLTGRKANVVDNKIYVMGGATFVQGIIFTSATNYVYDQTNDSWSAMAPIPVPVEGYASAVLDGKIYLIGGGTETSHPIDASNLVQIFDPETNSWINGTSVPVGVSGAGACATSGLLAPERIYVVGGTTRVSGGWLSMDVEDYYRTDLNQVYDPETSNWSVGASLPDKRLSSSLVNVDDLLYAIGGQNGTDNGIVLTERSNMTEVMQRFASTKVQATLKYVPLGYNLNGAVVDSSSIFEMPFLWLSVAVSMAVAAVVAVAVMVYFKKRQRE